MDGFVGQIGQFRQIPANELSIRVKLLALAGGVEDSEIRLRIAAAAGRPLPATVVGRQVEIVEFFCKVAFTPAPVQPQVLGQEARHHHPQAVVHVARLVNLSHGCIYQWITRSAIAPRSKQGFGIIAMFPLDVVIFSFEGVMRCMRKVSQNLGIKVPPDQLAEPHSSTFTASALSIERSTRQLPYRHGPKPQMHAKITWPFDGREVSRLAIPVHTP